MEVRIDITDVVANGDVLEIIDFLSTAYRNGYEKLYWDGNAAEIRVYKEKEDALKKSNEKTKDPYLDHILVYGKSVIDQIDSMIKAPHR